MRRRRAREGNVPQAARLFQQSSLPAGGEDWIGREVKAEHEVQTWVWSPTLSSSSSLVRSSLSKMVNTSSTRLSGSLKLMAGIQARESLKTLCFTSLQLNPIVNGINISKENTMITRSNINLSSLTLCCGLFSKAETRTRKVKSC